MFTEATCANCHKVEDVGRHVGPDLSRLVDRSPRSLLVDTIDPNRVVDHRFIEYTVVTTNGLQISGMLFDESGDSITLADLKGELQLSCGRIWTSWSATTARKCRRVWRPTARYSRWPI